MSTGISKFSSFAVASALTPPLTISLFALLLGFGAPPVKEWFWPAPVTNVAEAASLGDAGRIQVLASEGAPLDASLPVRADIRERGEPATASSLEAAIRRRRDSIVEMLLELGARPSADEVRRLLCVAAEVKADNAADVLRKRYQLPAISCEASPR